MGDRSTDLWLSELLLILSSLPKDLVDSRSIGIPLKGGEVDIFASCESSRKGTCCRADIVVLGSKEDSYVRQGQSI